MVCLLYTTLEVYTKYGIVSFLCSEGEFVLFHRRQYAQIALHTSGVVVMDIVLNRLNKLKSYVFDVEERDGALWGVAECEVYGELTDEELSKLKESISSQAADGFGEGFEQREIKTEDGDIYAHLWNSGPDWSVSAEEELFGQTQEVEMTLG